MLIVLFPVGDFFSPPVPFSLFPHDANGVVQGFALMRPLQNEIKKKKQQQQQQHQRLTVCYYVVGTSAAQPDAFHLHGRPGQRPGQRPERVGPQWSSH